MKRATRLSIFFLLLCFTWASASATPLAGQSSTDSASSKRSKKDRKEKSSDQKSAKAGKLDLNTASKEELDALAGIDDALAQKIIEGRPYKSKRDLVSKGVLPSSAYDKIKDQVTARGGEQVGSRKNGVQRCLCPCGPGKQRKA